MSLTKVQLYTLILAQLLEDGFDSVADQLSASIGIPLASPGVSVGSGAGRRADPAAVVRPGRLTSLIERGLAKERGLVSGGGHADDSFGAVTVYGGVIADDDTSIAGIGSGGDTSMTLARFAGVGSAVALPPLVLSEGGGADDAAADTSSGAAPPTNFVTRFVLTHKLPVLVSCFSADGSLLLTGSADSTMKLLDVARARDISEIKRELEQSGGVAPGMSSVAAGVRPQLGSYYEHEDAVTAVDFHPYRPIFASGSADRTVRYFDYRQRQLRRSVQSSQDQYPISSIHFHPSGDFMLVASKSNVVRLYDVAQNRCFGRQQGESNHLGPINMARWSPDGQLIATASEDGMIKLWDGRTLSCTSSWKRAHDAAPVHSVQFSRSGKYLLTSGANELSFLWDVSTGKKLHQFGRQSARGGAAGSGRPLSPASAPAIPCFSSDEQFILMPESSNYGRSHAVSMWSTRTGQISTKHSGHNGAIVHLSASPTEHTFASSSLDHRLRVWYLEK